MSNLARVLTSAGLCLVAALGCKCTTTRHVTGPALADTTKVEAASNTELPLGRAAYDKFAADPNIAAGKPAPLYFGGSSSDTSAGHSGSGSYTARPRRC